jgi:predicted lipoprotein
MVLLALLVLLAIFLTLKPPFVIRPLADRTGSGAGAQNSQGAAARFVDPIWVAKVLPAIQEKAQDIAKILPEIRADPEAAGQKYGRSEATNPYNYMVKGTGKVTEIHNESQAGTAVVEIPGLNEKIALQIGPVVRGTALRDATGVVSFNQFSNQLDYADGKALEVAANLARKSRRREAHSDSAHAESPSGATAHTRGDHQAEQRVK